MLHINKVTPCCWHCNSLGIFMGHFPFVYFLLVVRVHVALLQLQQKKYGRLLVRASRRLAAKPSSGACDAAVGAACSRSPLASPRAPSTERGRQFRGSGRGEGRPRAQRHSRCAAPAGLRSKPAVLQRSAAVVRAAIVSCRRRCRGSPTARTGPGR